MMESDASFQRTGNVVVASPSRPFQASYELLGRARRSPSLKDLGPRRINTAFSLHDRMFPLYTQKNTCNMLVYRITRLI
jgi:hypothetical protein